ncbi:MAG TPA: putative DNA-binding domain-containing protein [Burkholderiaceae bacterium]
MSAQSQPNVVHAALRSAFGATCAYLGDELFEVCASGYIAHHPCTFRPLHAYCGAFSGWLARMLADQPLVAELARLEWNLGDVAGAASVPSLRGEVQLVLHPSARVLALDWNTMEVWHALRDGAPPPDASTLPQPVHWLAWRGDAGTLLRQLCAAEAEALRGFRPGCTASGNYLTQWLVEGVLVSA